MSLVPHQYVCDGLRIIDLLRAPANAARMHRGYRNDSQSAFQGARAKLYLSHHRFQSSAAGAAQKPARLQKHPQGEVTMRNTVRTIAAATALGAMLALSPVIAQQAAFDGKKFFDELGARSVSMPAGFDSKKFFDELSAKSVSSGKKFDAKAFFDELQSRGVKMPANFDGKKFFSDIATTGSAMPPMVDMKN